MDLIPRELDKGVVNKYAERLEALQSQYAEVAQKRNTIAYFHELMRRTDEQQQRMKDLSVEEVSEEMGGSVPQGPLQFPYAGVPGVLEPLAKPLPEKEEQQRIVPESAGSVGPCANMDAVQLGQMKSGLDMAFQQIKSDVFRMGQSSAEVERMWSAPQDQAEADALLRAGAIGPADHQMMLDQAALIREQQRQKDELLAQVAQDKEDQAWLEIEERNRALEAAKEGRQVERLDFSQARRDAQEAALSTIQTEAGPAVLKVGVLGAVNLPPDTSSAFVKAQLYEGNPSEGRGRLLNEVSSSAGSGPNPVWDGTLVFSLPDEYGNCYVRFVIVSTASFNRETVIGQTVVPLKAVRVNSEYEVGLDYHVDTPESVELTGHEVISLRFDWASSPDKFYQAPMGVAPSVRDMPMSYFPEQLPESQMQLRERRAVFERHRQEEAAELAGLGQPALVDWGVPAVPSAEGRVERSADVRARSLEDDRRGGGYSMPGAAAVDWSKPATPRAEGRVERAADDMWGVTSMLPGWTKPSTPRAEGRVERGVADDMWNMNSVLTATAGASGALAQFNPLAKAGLELEAPPERLEDLPPVESLYQEVMDAHLDGAMVNSLSGQTVFLFVYALANYDMQRVDFSQLLEYARLTMDMVMKYNVSIEIVYWGLSSLLRIHSVAGPKKEQISGPMWLIATDILKGPLSADEALQCALLSAFAHVGVAGSSPVEHEHIDFAVEFLNAHDERLMPVQMEEVLQVFLIGKTEYRRAEQVATAVACMRRFRFEPRLLTRAMLTVAAIAEELPTPEADIPLLAAAMDVYPDDRRLQGAGMTAVAAVVDKHTKQVHHLVRRTVLFACKNHPDSRTVQKNACAFFERTAELWTDAEALLQVIETAHVFHSDRQVVLKACNAIKSMSGLFGKLEGKLQLCHFEKLVVLGEAMVGEPEAVQSLCESIAAMSVASDWVREQLSLAAATAVPVHALHRYPTNSDVAGAAVAALRALALSDRSLQHLFKLQAVFLLFDLLQEGTAQSNLAAVLTTIGNFFEAPQIRQQARSIDQPSGVDIVMRTLGDARAKDCNVLAMAMKVCSHLVADPTSREDPPALIACVERPEFGSVCRKYAHLFNGKSIEQWCVRILRDQIAQLQKPSASGRVFEADGSRHGEKKKPKDDGGFWGAEPVADESDDDVVGGSRFRMPATTPKGKKKRASVVEDDLGASDKSKRKSRKEERRSVADDALWSDDEPVSKERRKRKSRA